VFEGMEESGSEGLDDLLVKLNSEGWMKVSQLFIVRLMKLCLVISFEVEVLPLIVCHEVLPHFHYMMVLY